MVSGVEAGVASDAGILVPSEPFFEVSSKSSVGVRSVFTFLCVSRNSSSLFVVLWGRSASQSRARTTHIEAKQNYCDTFLVNSLHAVAQPFILLSPPNTDLKVMPEYP